MSGPLHAPTLQQKESPGRVTGAWRVVLAPRVTALCVGKGGQRSAWRLPVYRPDGLGGPRDCEPNNADPATRGGVYVYGRDSDPHHHPMDHSLASTA